MFLVNENSMDYEQMIAWDSSSTPPHLKWLNCVQLSVCTVIYNTASLAMYRGCGKQYGDKKPLEGYDKDSVCIAYFLFLNYE